MIEPDAPGPPTSEAPDALTSDVAAAPTAPVVAQQDEAPAGAPALTRGWAWTLGVVILALLIRVIPPWNAVLGDDHVSFLETDAWYHMRLVDALLHDFPWRLWHDAYLVHPGGEPVNAGPVFDWMVALPAWILGFGSPSARLIDVVGAFVPAVVGALTVVPVVTLGTLLFSARAGLWAGLLFAVMPGQTLQRSLLGFTDHHCAETLLSTTALMFLVRAIVVPASRRRDAVLAGLSLGLYLLTWGGGVFIVALVTGWAVLTITTRIWQERDLTDVTTVVIPMLAIAAVMVAPWARTRPHFAYQIGTLVGGLLVLVALQGAAGQARRRGWGPGRLLGILAGATVVAAIAGAAAMGDSLGSLRGDMSRVSPFRTNSIVSEARPLLATPGMMRPVPLWTEFGVGSVLATLGAGLLTGHAFRGTGAARGLLVLWTLVTVGATLGQVRFTYYLGVNVALLAGLALERLVEVFGSRAALRMGAAAVAACVIVVPSLIRLNGIRAATSWPDRNWMDALSWMRTNTPEPFGDPATYLASHVERPSAYGVLAWWDAGYWITRVARRVPITNPRQTAMQDVATFLVETDVPAARVRLDRLGARYVIVDVQLQVGVPGVKKTGGFFPAIATTAGKKPATFCEAYVDRVAGTPPDVLCSPEYHRTMAMRLYLHGGRAVTPITPVKVMRVRRRGGINEIEGSWEFTDLAEARSFVSTREKPETMRIVCPDTKRSCVPLEALPDFTSAYRALSTEDGNPGSPAVVHVFEYRPAGSAPLR